MLAKLFPTWKLVPTKDITEVGFKDPEKRERVRNNPVGYFGKPRLNTALQLLLTTEEIGRHLHEVQYGTVWYCFGNTWHEVQIGIAMPILARGAAL